MYIKTDTKDIYRTTNGVLVNINKGELEQYKKKKMSAIKMDNIEKEISSLKSDMEEIKTLLRGLTK